MKHTIVSKNLTNHYAYIIPDELVYILAHHKIKHMKFRFDEDFEYGKSLTGCGKIGFSKEIKNSAC
jgi:hypothetical protein